MVHYSSVLYKVQRGYPLKDYEVIIDAMLALEFVEQYDMPDADKLRILQTQLFALQNG